ncbi:MAG: aminoacyl-tRNA hydrolase [Campylobacteraceae bacterium]|nr:aminoacyl-tRNA hydrolase [Campylobacteraceae bacterium]
MILVVGLGNPTQRYEKTRHNIGFWVVDILKSTLASTPISKPQFHGDLAKTADFLLLKPQTYMNNSGQSVVAVMSYFKSKMLVVVHDDLDLPLGALRFKVGGGSGGHNGLKSIDAHYGSDYFRVRIGIGKPVKKIEVVDYVLKPFLPQELPTAKEVASTAAEAILALRTMDLKEIPSKFTCKPKQANND